MTFVNPIKLQIFNLDLNVTQNDLKEFFSEFGPIQTIFFNQDNSGKSLGSANLTFERKIDGIKAMITRNGRTLKGKPMKISSVESEINLFDTNQDLS